MHKWLMLMAASLSVTCQAGLIAYDDLEDAPIGSLVGLNSGTGFAAGYDSVKEQNISVAKFPMVYSSGELTINGGERCLRALIANTSQDILFTRALGSHTGDAYYLSFLFRTPTAGMTSNEDFFSFGFIHQAGETKAGFLQRLGGDGVNHVFGVRVNGTDQKGTEATLVNQTYFIVLRIGKQTSGAAVKFKDVSIYVNPTTLSEPETPTVIRSGLDSTVSDAAFLGMRVTFAEVGDTYYLDNIRVGDTYESVVTPFSAQVAQPEFSVDSGMYEAVELSLTSATPGATIRYTLDGSTPTRENGFDYAEPLAVTDSRIVRAFAFAEGLEDSPVAQMAYFIPFRWTGAAGDKLWSSGGNWSTSQSPANQDLLFGAADMVKVNVINSIIDQSWTVSSLMFTNTSKAATTSGASYHNVNLPAGNRLTVDGSSGVAKELLLFGGAFGYSGKYDAGVTFTGGGELVLNNPACDVVITATSSNDNGAPKLNVQDLSLFEADVRDFWVGKGGRTCAYLYLPKRPDGESLIRATRFAVGDSQGSSERHEGSTLFLGTNDTLQTDTLVVGASDSLQNCQDGTVGFAAGLMGGKWHVRGKTDDSVSLFCIGTHGGYVPSTRSVKGTVALTNGTVDLKFKDMRIAESGGRGNPITAVTGSFAVESGTVVGESLVLGRALNGRDDGNATTGYIYANLSILGDCAMSLNSMTMTEQKALYAYISITSTVTVAAGSLTVRDGIVTGKRFDYAKATGLASRFHLSGGKLEANGTMAPASGSTNVFTEIALSGNAALIVTNADHSAELYVDSGLLSLTNGTIIADSLVTTNSTVTTEIVLSGTAAGEFPQIVVNDSLKLGGTLNVVLNGHTLREGNEWIIASGTGVREGEFAAVNLPSEEMELLYTPDGYSLRKPIRPIILQLF